MKFSTVNAKSPQYDENHIIYVGTHTGSFKKLEVFKDNPHKEKNFQKLDELSKISKVTCMDFGDNESSQILIGNSNHSVKVFECSSESYSSCFNIEGGPGAIVGLGRYDECIVAASETGQIQIVKYPKSIFFSVGDNISKMRLCSEQKNLMVTGGKGLKNILKVWDINTKTAVFSAKNVKKDMLELEQPIWDCDVVFLDKHIVASCSRHGYVRVYDIRGPARRPVQAFSTEDDQLSFTSLTTHSDYLYAGTTSVGARAFDRRNMKKHIHTYKGFTGSISSLCLDPTGKYLFSASLDRNVRVHQTQNKSAMVYQCYVKSKPTAVICREFKIEEDDCVMIEEVDKKEAVEDEEFDEIFSKMPTVKDEPTSSKKRKTVDHDEEKPVKTSKKKLNK